MYKTAFFVFLGCFLCYMLFTRKPDYFEGEFITGKVIVTDSAGATNKAVAYPVGSQTFTTTLDGLSSWNASNGQKVEVIYDPTYPEVGARFSVLGYWLQLPELLVSIVVFAILFGSSVLITGKPLPQDEPQEETARKRKYKD